MVSTELDDFLQEKIVSSTVWKALLSNGQTVIQDDNRPGEEKSAWIRLKDYLYERDLSIKSLSFSFRSNTISNFLPENAAGYFFVKNAVSGIGSDYTSEFYIFGYLKDKTVYWKRYKIPEMMFFDEGERTIESCGNSLIFNLDEPV